LKAYKKPAVNRLTILSILLLIISSGCSITRKLKDDQALVRKITIKGVDDEFKELALNYVDKEQQPNNWLNLQFYYMFSKNGKKNIGEAPALLDSNLVEASRIQIEKFLRNKGYLKARVADSIRIKKKKAELIFTATQGPMFKVRNFTDSIPDKRVKKLYDQYVGYILSVKPGTRFDTDSLAADRDELYQLMKRNGYFDFYRQYINYNYDSTYNSAVVDLKLIIDNPDGRNAHPVYTINNTLITIARNAYGRTSGAADTIQVDSQFRFVDYSGRFKPRTVTDYVFQRKGELYNIDKQTLTTARLSELNVFRNVPNPSYTKLADSSNRLNTKIDIIPLKRMSDRIEGEFLFNGGRYGYNIGNTFTNRNMFKRAAVLQVKLNWSILFGSGSNTNSSGGVENQDFKVGVSLSYPRLLVPFSVPVLGKYGVPHTIFSSNYQLFYQKGLVKRESFINSVTYDFFETAHKRHTVTPISIEFSRGTIDPAANSLLLQQNRYSYVYLIGRTIFTSGSQYTYQLNADRLNSYQNFTYFRGSLDVGGNTLALFSKLFNAPKDTLGNRTILGYNFAQYTKAEIDLRIYKSYNNEKQFVFRINPGIGVPYGNSDQLIFEKNFYAGGANDMRAWLPRTLGPGQFNRASYGIGGQADTTRSRLKYIDQFGEIKIIGNAEYRYKLADNFFGSKLKGAMFVDFGNVWRLGRHDENPGGEFKLNKLWESTAIGIGTGLRFDLTFFVFRFDVAFKFKDPQFSGSDQWVLLKHSDELFKSGAFKDKYKANNSGEGYSFMQLNFGVGLPF
jgi:outer membrane protein insertion porin family